MEIMEIQMFFGSETLVARKCSFKNWRKSIFLRILETCEALKWPKHIFEAEIFNINLFHR